MNVLLLGSPYNAGDPTYLGRSRQKLQDFLENRDPTLLLGNPSADETREIVRVFKRIGCPLECPSKPTQEDVMGARSLFVTGTHVNDILQTIHEQGILEPLVQRVRQGVHYIGMGAGAIVAGVSSPQSEYAHLGILSCSIMIAKDKATMAEMNQDIDRTTLDPYWEKNSRPILFLWESSAAIWCTTKKMYGMGMGRIYSSDGNAQFITFDHTGKSPKALETLLRQ